MPIDAAYIRRFASDVYVKPARKRGDPVFSIPVKAVEADLKKLGLQSSRTPLVCSAIGGDKFQRENQIVLENWDGPASRQSTTVVFHFRFGEVQPSVEAAQEETHEERAARLTGQLRGLMKDVIAAHGGPEGYLRWVRGEGDEVGE